MRIGINNGNDGHPEVPPLTGAQQGFLDGRICASPVLTSAPLGDAREMGRWYAERYRLFGPIGAGGTFLLGMIPSALEEPTIPREEVDMALREFDGFEPVSPLDQTRLREARKMSGVDEEEPIPKRQLEFFLAIGRLLRMSESQESSD